MQPVDYLAGMTRSEAIRYVQSLPGLTREEFAELITAAERKPAARHSYAGAEIGGTTKARIRALVRYLKRKRVASRAQMVSELKWNGSTLYLIIRHAEAFNLIERELIDNRTILYKVRK